MKKWENAWALLPILLLVILKWPVLDLPHYWDEAFPYSYAIQHMVDHGISLRSQGVPADFGTGHPLWYYALQSGWNALVGEAFALQRLFPLLNAVLVLWLVFLIGKRHGGLRVGLTASLLLVAQGVFMAQSSFQLPEMHLTLCFLASWWFMRTERRGMMAIAMTLLALTKETGVILVMLLFLVEQVFFLKGQSASRRIRSTAIYLVPAAATAAFFIDQWLAQGWMLYPRHVGFMDDALARYGNQLKRYAAYLFLYQGRNAAVFGVLAMVIIHVVRRRLKKLPMSAIDGGRELAAWSVVLVLFLAFSAANFYSNRYILVLFPLFALLLASGLEYVFRSRIALMVGALMAVIAGWQALSSTGPTDHSPGYANLVRAQVAAVHWLQVHADQDAEIITGFLMSKNLSSACPGFVDEAEVFRNVTNDAARLDQPLDGHRWVVVCSNESELAGHPALGEYVLEQHFEAGPQWVKVYGR